jgi:biotin operon repressor
MNLIIKEILLLISISGKNVASRLSEQAGISRQAASSRISNAIKKGFVISSGKGRGICYRIAELNRVHQQTEQEPVATKLESHQFTAFHVSALDFKKLQKLPIGTKLYTAPPKREPLSIQEIYDLDRYSQQPFEIYTVRECISWIRKVEKAHGIGGEE